MRIVSTGYTKTMEYKDPVAWLERIRFYTGVLEHLGKRHDVASIEQIDYTGRLDREGVSYHFIDAANDPGLLHEYIDSLNPDIILINGFIFPRRVIALRRRLGRSARIMILHRSEKPFSGWRRFLQKLADRSVNDYLFSSLEFLPSWRRNISEKKVRQVLQSSSIFRPIEKQDARKKLAIEGHPVYLWVGRLDRNKDPLSVVRGFLAFNAHHPGSALYMIFQSDELLPELRDLVHGHPAVTLIGKLPHAELGNWYSGADFFISGSHYEGCGIAAIEAMSCGCIPILTDIASFRGMSGHGRCGFLYQPGDEKHLLGLMEKSSRLNLDEERLKTIEHFNEHLSFGAIANQIENILNNKGG